MNKYNSLILPFCISLLLLGGCAVKTTQEPAPMLTGVVITDLNGNLNEVAAATIRVAVGLALNAKPETVKPAYDVSTILLAVLGEQDYSVVATQLDGIISGELDKLHVDALTKQSFYDLVILVKAQIKQQLANQNLDIKGKTVVIVQVLKIVQESSAARLNLTQK